LIDYKNYTGRGYLSLVLHAHLPFVRHPEYQNFMEENWLFEAISETYLPLLRVFNKLSDEEIPYKVTISISPTLSAMLTDSLLQDRYIAHLERLLDLGEKEIERTKGDKTFSPLAKMYFDLYKQNYQDFTEKYKKNILVGFKSLQNKGNLELIATAATHSYLPNFQLFPEAIEAQIQTAVSSHTRNFNKEPNGFWIPECGYFPGLEKHLKSNNLKYFFVVAHGLLIADEKPNFGVYAPVACGNGIHAFGRDIQSSQAVWSSEVGYPGDYVYREFYRDIGWDLPIDYIGPYIHDGKFRVNTGYKYYAITGKTDEKKLYDIEKASQKAVEHAENFIFNRIKQISKLSQVMDRPPILVAPYDAELFGHWWYEGPIWIEHLIRKIHKESKQIEMVSPSDYLALYPKNQVVTPTFSSWGNKGYSEVWVDGKNDWIYRHIHKVIERMSELVERYPNENGVKRRILNQAAREVMLSQASDWPFIMKTGTTVPYAIKRVKEHIYNFNRIYDELCRNTVNTEWLTGIEKKNNILPDIDYRIFQKIEK
jgi:1,4-alpha-glucan branching enzyme